MSNDALLIGYFWFVFGCNVVVFTRAFLRADTKGISIFSFEYQNAIMEQVSGKEFWGCTLLGVIFAGWVIAAHGSH